MREIILGKDILEHRDEFSIGITEEFFNLIDPEGYNVIMEDKQVLKNEVRFMGLFKLKERELPFEMYASLPLETYRRIVATVDIKALNEVH